LSAIDYSPFAMRYLLSAIRSQLLALRMKVLYVYKDYFPVLGGIENHIKLLAEGMAARGVSVQVLVTNTTWRTIREKRNDVPIIKAGRLANISSAPLSLALFWELNRLRPDIAHLHAPYPIGELAQLWGGHARKIVVTYHSDIVRQKYLRIGYHPFLKQLLARADAISISNPTYPQLSPFVAPHAHKCIVIHHGANLSRFAPTPQSQARAQAIRAEHDNLPLILFVGRLRYYKGLENLIAAMSQVTNARALIVGTGPMAATWQALAQTLNVTERVRFVGNVPDDDLPAYYQAARMFVLPSTHSSETWGAVQIEAMASGLPCICTELGTGTSYVNQHGVTGLVTPPREPTALAQAINTLLTDEPLRQRLGQAAHARAWNEFTHTAMVEQTHKLYESLVASD
jgi:rhamnosyl/mannosyltransferase